MQSDITVDCRGLLCPLPLIETKKAIKSAKQGETIQVIIDNEISQKNLKMFLADNAIQAEFSKENTNFMTLIRIDSTFNPVSNPEDYCPAPNASPTDSRDHKNLIIVLKSNEMGVGDSALGQLLLKGFLSTIPEMDILPKEIICYNSAVKLAIKGTSTAHSLNTIAALGVKITLCGTCVDFFKIKDDVEIGEISNMYAIASSMFNASYIIEP